MRDAKHYKKLIQSNPDATINFSLAASAVYAARFGTCEAEDRGSDEWRGIALDLKRRIGEELTAEDVLAEMGKPKEPQINPRDLKVAKRVLDTITVERGTPAAGRPTQIPLKKVGYSISAAIADELDNLPGFTSHHVERAIRLYLKLVK